MEPKISVIIPVYNGEEFISDCIQSVHDQLYKNIEIIVVDDGSKDNTKNVVINNFPDVMYIYQKNNGPAAARNKGIIESSGDYIAFLDSDDIWMKDKIQQQIKIINENPDVKISHTNVVIMQNGKLHESIYPNINSSDNMFHDLLLHKSTVVMSSLLIKRSCFEDVGLFDEELITSEDVHLFLKLALKYKFYYISEPYVIKKHHQNNLTNMYNPNFGQGTIKCLEKIEMELPQFSKNKSSVMREAYFLRYRLIAIYSAKRNEYKNALILYKKALFSTRDISKRLKMAIMILKMCGKLLANSTSKQKNK